MFALITFVYWLQIRSYRNQRRLRGKVRLTFPPSHTARPFIGDCENLGKVKCSANLSATNRTQIICSTRTLFDCFMYIAFCCVEAVRFSGAQRATSARYFKSDEFKNRAEALFRDADVAQRGKLTVSEMRSVRQPHSSMYLRNVGNQPVPT